MAETATLESEYSGIGIHLVGWCRVFGQGTTGRPGTIRHGEMLNKDGTLYTANLRRATQVDRLPQMAASRVSPSNRQP
jgi:hypothetical protein